MSDDTKIVELKTRPAKQNAETIRLLKQWLAMAETGELQIIAMAGILSDGASQSCASSSDDIQRLLGAIAILNYRIMSGYVESEIVG